MADTIYPWGYYDYQGVGKSRLTSYLQNDDQPQNLVEALLTPFRDIERLHHQLFDMLSIYRATGKGLDAFGEMVHILRLGRDDETYRQAILAKRFSSGGSGTWPEVKRALKSIATGADVYKVDHFPAAYIAVITKTATNVDKALPRSLYDLSVAGVHGYETHDYGLGGFVLAGVAGSAANVLGAQPTASGDDDTAIGIDKTVVGQVLGINSYAGTLGGTPLAGEIEFRTPPTDYGSRSRGAYLFGTFQDYQP